MKILLASLCFLFALPVFAQVKENDTAFFQVGNGTRGGTIWISKGEMHQFWFCDICVGEETLGKYTQKGDTLFVTDTVLIVYSPHFATATDTTVTRCHRVDTLYLGKIGEFDCLYGDAAKFAHASDLFAESNDRRVLESFMIGIARKE
ncbi:MAG TPA: hypothetical protein VK826_01515 [Bacteroidia bacterium]|nr:hypothetical protein [Bacteroidia bacterium]